MASLLLNNNTLTKNLHIASRFTDRLLGLIPKTKMDQDEVLWILQCNSIHTFFMKFSIDCVFVDKQKIIRKIVYDVKPWKMVWPIWKANSVFEMNAGLANQFNLKIGDQLHVGN